MLAYSWCFISGQQWVITGRTRKSTECVWKKKRCTMHWAQGLQNNKGQFEIKFCCQETVTTKQKCWVAEILERWWKKTSQCLCYVRSVKQHGYLGKVKHNNADPNSSKSSPSASGHRLIQSLRTWLELVFNDPGVTLLEEEEDEEVKCVQLYHSLSTESAQTCWRMGSWAERSLCTLCVHSLELS